MMRRLIAGVAMLLLSGGVASAHRLDEYLQATMLHVERDHVQASMRLIPGVAVSSSIIASIDRNGDGLFSEQENTAYAAEVLGDLSLTIDGVRIEPRLVGMTFPGLSTMREGLGEIHLEFVAALPPGGAHRVLMLQNRHQRLHSAYLVNSLVPDDPALRITAQRRNEQQSLYELDYTQTGPAPVGWRTRLGGALAASGFMSLFRLGMRHITEGTDHLLFLLVLLLPAPLLVRGARWAAYAGWRGSLRHILAIVTAFTAGHSLTLVLAAWGLVSVPGRPVEVLIAVSILVSAIHALRPLFPGREAWVAAFFGLVHGLAFAATLSSLGVSRGERLFGILGFNLGIEAMQLAVVAAIMPSLVLLSRTRFYTGLRMGGALFAATAALGWIYERLADGHQSVDAIVGRFAHFGVWAAGGLFLISLVLGQAAGRSALPVAPGRGVRRVMPGRLRRGGLLRP